MNTIYLVRHADAGEPWEFPQDDSKRPLSRFGREQAKELGLQMKTFGIHQMFSSSVDRCLQTVQTFHRVFNAKIETTQILLPGRINVVTPFMRTLPAEPVVVCTHSDNIYAFLHQIHNEEGVEIPKVIAVPSGSCWVIEHEGAIFTSVKYIPPGVEIPAPIEASTDDDLWVE